MQILIQFVIGLTFGSGLVIAGMTNPAKVLNFLDFAAIPSGGWDPSLAFVLAGAIAVTFIGFKIVLRRKQPVFADRFHLPSAKELDLRIVAGPAIFGVGWGLAGFCPGPALAALSGGSVAAFQFVAAMLIGMGAAKWAATRA
jgi:uncharacterized membrane protein YedE/YeeE